MCNWLRVLIVSQEHDRQYMHIGTMVEFAFALVGKLDVINKHSFNDFKLRVGEFHMKATFHEQGPHAQKETLRLIRNAHD